MIKLELVEGGKLLIDPAGWMISPVYEGDSIKRDQVNFINPRPTNNCFGFYTVKGSFESWERKLARN